MGKFKPKEEPSTKNDWNLLHDCWLYVKGTKPTHEQLESLLNQLPPDLQFVADEFGMQNSEFREGVIEWIQSNHFKEK